MHLAMVALLLAVIEEEDVLVADALCLDALACTAGMEESSDMLVEMIFAKGWRVLGSIACGNTTGADLVKDACLPVRTLSDRL